MNRSHSTEKSTQPLQTLALEDAAQIKAAEYWLKLGNVEQSSMELGALPEHAWKHPAAVRVRVAAMGVLRMQSAENNAACRRQFRSRKTLPLF